MPSWESVELPGGAQFVADGLVRAARLPNRWPTTSPPACLSATALYLVAGPNTWAISASVGASRSIDDEQPTSVGADPASDEINSSRAVVTVAFSEAPLRTPSTYFFPSVVDPHGRQNMVVPELDPRRGR